MTPRRIIRGEGNRGSNETGNTAQLIDTSNSLSKSKTTTHTYVAGQPAAHTSITSSSLAPSIPAHAPVDSKRSSPTKSRAPLSQVGPKAQGSSFRPPAALKRQNTGHNTRLRDASNPYGQSAAAFKRANLASPSARTSVSPIVRTNLEVSKTSVALNRVVERHDGMLRISSFDPLFGGLILQPDSSVISEQQLANEIKNIYAELIMTEAKCISLVNALVADPNKIPADKEWSQMIQAHKTLMYDHHDFFMATQHPSATPVLRNLAIKYSMPARLWRHSIHAFLELLRSRKPGEGEFMLSFILSAYNMVALLYDTIPAFTDTWIECLGDLARYRMAVETESEAIVIWAACAIRWYSIASERHPHVGRLYHHIGIIERPSLQKFCLYVKALTCTINFPNARESLETFCLQIANSPENLANSAGHLEARIVACHALFFSGANASTLIGVIDDIYRLMASQRLRLKDIGPAFAVSNISAMMQYSVPGSNNNSNLLVLLYGTEISLSSQPGTKPHRVISNAPHMELEQLYKAAQQVNEDPAIVAMTRLCYGSFDRLLGGYDDVDRLDEALPMIYVMLVWIHSQYILRARLESYSKYEWPAIFDSRLVKASSLARLLNSVLFFHRDAINDSILEAARHCDTHITDQRSISPLPEDLLIRGLLWGQFFYRPGFFEGRSADDPMATDTLAVKKARAQMIVRLGLYFAFNTSLLTYDLQQQIFSAGVDDSENQEIGELHIMSTSSINFDANSDLVHISDFDGRSDQSNRPPMSVSSSSDDDTGDNKNNKNDFGNDTTIKNTVSIKDEKDAQSDDDHGFDMITHEEARANKSYLLGAAHCYESAHSPSSRSDTESVLEIDPDTVPESVHQTVDLRDLSLRPAQ